MKSRLTIKLADFSVWQVMKHIRAAARLLEHRKGELRPVVTVCLGALACVMILLPGIGKGEFFARMASADGATLASIVLRSHYPTAVPVTIVDIDQRTHETWGSPAAAPRKPLFDIIQKISAVKPHAIIIDVDFANSSEADVVVIASALTALKDRGDASALLMVRRVRADDRMPQAAFLQQVDPRIDAIVRASTNLVWVSALFTPEEDGLFRRWRPFHALCSDTPQQGIGSAALIAEVVRRAGLAALPALRARLDTKAQEICLQKSAAAPADSLTWLSLPSYDWPIAYSFIWPRAGAVQTAMTGGPKPNERRPLLVRISAADVQNAASLSADSFHQRVVILGSSHADSQDIHRTPVGLMPGAYIIGNTVAGSRDMLDALFSPTTAIFAAAVPIFVLCAFSALIFKGWVAAAASALIVGLFAVFGFIVGVPPFVIQQGAIRGLAILVLFVLLRKVAHAAAEFGRGRRKRSSVAEFLLSDFGLRLFTRKKPGRETQA